MTSKRISGHWVSLLWRWLMESRQMQALIQWKYYFWFLRRRRLGSRDTVIVGISKILSLLVWSRIPTVGPPQRNSYNNVSSEVQVVWRGCRSLFNVGRCGIALKDGIRTQNTTRRQWPQCLCKKRRMTGYLIQSRLRRLQCQRVHRGVGKSRLFSINYMKAQKVWWADWQLTEVLRKRLLLLQPSAKPRWNVARH